MKLLLIFIFLTGLAKAAIPLEEIKGGMGFNEGKLFGANPLAQTSKSAVIGMGAAPRGDATPIWWTPDNKDLKSSKSWGAIAPWFVIHPGVDNLSKNYRVSVYNIEAWIFKKSISKWIKISDNKTPIWASYFGTYASGTGFKEPIAPRKETDGTYSYKLDDLQKYIVHGGVFKIAIDGNDLGGVFFRAKTRLILEDKNLPDDRSLAKVLFSIGGDYYPTVSSKVSDFRPMGFVPNICGSKYYYIKPFARSSFAVTSFRSSNNLASDYGKSGGIFTMPEELFKQTFPFLAR